MRPWDERRKVHKVESALATSPLAEHPAQCRDCAIEKQETALPIAGSAIYADDDRVRVTTWTFEANAETGHHRHEFDYVVVPITGGTFAVHEASGEVRVMTQEPAVAYTGRAGTEHNVVNQSGQRAVFVEVELKGRLPR